MSRPWGSLLPLISLVVLFVLVTLLLPSFGGYYVQISIYLLINVILVASFRFITTMGRWSFAHIPLSGVGGYTSAILTTEHHLSFWVTLELGGLCAAVIGLLLSYPCLRTSGLYFFMSTFAAGALIVWSWTTFIVPFGGINGVYGVAAPDPLTIPGLPTLRFDTSVAYAQLVAVVTLVSLIILVRLEQSRFGAALKAIRSQTGLAMSLGMNVRLRETIAFVLGSFFAGIAGVLFVHTEGIANATDFGTTQGINVVMFTVVGGAESFWGPPLGTLTMTILGQAIEAYPDYVQYIPLVYGIMTIAIVLTFRGGLISTPRLLIHGIQMLRGRSVSRGRGQGGAWH